MSTKSVDILAKKIANILKDAGGEIVGRTKLQKITYLQSLADGDDSFHFEYHHYGPYSEDLAQITSFSKALGLISEEERRAEWGGRYSIFRLSKKKIDPVQQHHKLINTAAQADTVVLELAATAAFFAKQKEKKPWEKTATMKREKATAKRMADAQALYSRLCQIAPTLPKIASSP